MLAPAAGSDAPAAEPVWQLPQFAHTVLGASLAAVPAAPAATGPACKMASLVESLALEASLLEELQKASAAPVVRHAASRAAGAFKRCVELCRHMPQVKDNETFYSLLAPFVARIKALEPGGQVVVPAGWRTGLVMLVLHCEASDDFTLAVVCAADGLAHHPRRPDPATGETVYNSPLVLRGLEVRGHISVMGASLEVDDCSLAPPVSLVARQARARALSLSARRRASEGEVASREAGPRGLSVSGGRSSVAVRATASSAAREVTPPSP